MDDKNKSSIDFTTQTSEEIVAFVIIVIVIVLAAWFGLGHRF